MTFPAALFGLLQFPLLRSRFLGTYWQRRFDPGDWNSAESIQYI